MLEKTNNKAARDLPLTNDRIKFPKVRLLGSSGEQIGIVENQEAKSLAKDQQLDLVLISDKSDPPVCRIIDYGKYKFTQEKKAKEARKKQQSVSIKEVKMRYNIEEHDYKVRINQAIRFLQSGNKVKMTITFRGREIQHVSLALELFNKMASELNEVSEPQQSPLREGKNVIMILSPKK